MFVCSYLNAQNSLNCYFIATKSRFSILLRQGQRAFCQRLSIVIKGHTELSTAQRRKRHIINYLATSIKKERKYDSDRVYIIYINIPVVTEPSRGIRGANASPIIHPRLVCLSLASRRATAPLVSVTNNPGKVPDALRTKPMCYLGMSDYRYHKGDIYDNQKRNKRHPKKR